MLRTSLLFPILVIAALSACEKETRELKSPCSGIDKSPCGDKRPVNDWWLRQV